MTHQQLKESEIPDGSNYRWDYYPQDKTGYLKLLNLHVDHTVPLVRGRVNLNIGKGGEVIGIEILL